MDKIAAAFIKAKKAFAPALKDKTNPHFRSKYADLGACIEAVDDALLANGIAMYQETTPDPAGIVVETILLHESGETIRSGKLHVPASRIDPQGFGSALTYARRYSLMAACGIAPEDDDGNAASEPKKVSNLSAASVKKDEFDALAPDEQTWIKELAEAVTTMVAAGDVKDAVDEIDHSIPQEGPKRLEKATEYKVALWHCLDSKTRSALTKYRESTKQAKAA